VNYAMKLFICTLRKQSITFYTSSVTNQSRLKCVEFLEIMGRNLHTLARIFYHLGNQKLSNISWANILCNIRRIGLVYGSYKNDSKITFLCIEK
jgi:hypothetical protein